MLALVEYYLSKVGSRLVNEEDGQGLIEYLLIGALISIGAIVAMTALNTQVGLTFGAITAGITP